MSLLTLTLTSVLMGRHETPDQGVLDEDPVDQATSQRSPGLKTCVREQPDSSTRLAFGSRLRATCWLAWLARGTARQQAPRCSRMLLQWRHQSAHSLPRSCPTCVGRLPLACQAAAVTADRAVDKDPRTKLQKVVVLGGTGRVGGSTAEALLDRQDSNILIANLVRHCEVVQHAEQ